MDRLFTLLCSGFLFALTVALGAGQAIGEQATSPPKLFSKPVSAGGVDFQVAAEATWHRPADVYGEFHPGIVLRIRNRTDKDLTFDLGGNLRVSLKTARGSELVGSPIGERHFPKPVKVAAGKSKTVSLPVQLVHTRIVHVCLGAKSDLVAGANWLTGDVPPGEYRLSVSLENSRRNDDAWHGEVRTETLGVDVKDPD